MIYELDENKQEAILVMKFEQGLSAHEIIRRFENEGYPITSGQVDAVCEAEELRRTELRKTA